MARGANRAATSGRYVSVAIGDRDSGSTVTGRKAPALARVPGPAFLIDNSVLQKLSRSPTIKQRFDEVTRLYPIYTCPPQVLEYCWSAQTKLEYAELRLDMELYTPARLTPAQNEILDIQQALWDNNVMRSAGNADVTIAAYAIVNDLTVLCSDHDFEHIAKILGSGMLKVEYLAE